MVRDWKQWEGRVVNNTFPLRQYLGGSEHSVVFLTERRGREPQKAAIKLMAVDPANTAIQLAALGVRRQAVSSPPTAAFRDGKLPAR